MDNEARKRAEKYDRMLNIVAVVLVSLLMVFLGSGAAYFILKLLGR